MSFWRWPNHWKAKTVNNLSAHLDVLPTLCELAGVEIPEELESKLEGFSLTPVLEAEKEISWHDDRLLYSHVGRWPSGLAEAHKYAMVNVRKGNYLLVRSNECGDPRCKEFQSQCTTMRAVNNGLTRTTYAYGTAQIHWGTVPMGQWALYDIKTDPGCENDLSYSNPELVANLAAAYDRWWEEMFPDMIAKGGDIGDPDVSAKASKKAREWKGPTTDITESSEASSNRQEVNAKESVMFKRMDVNRDNKVSRAEYVGLFKSVFKNKDANKDGLMSETEFGHAAFSSADLDSDGSLTAEEYVTLYSEQFTGRDSNQDGVVTADEM